MLNHRKVFLLTKFVLLTENVFGTNQRARNNFHLHTFNRLRIPEPVFVLWTRKKLLFKARSSAFVEATRLGWCTLARIMSIRHIPRLAAEANRAEKVNNFRRKTLVVTLPKQTLLFLRPHHHPLNIVTHLRMKHRVLTAAGTRGVVIEAGPIIITTIIIVTWGRHLRNVLTSTTISNQSRISRYYVN